jgi:intein/homing endonuclease
MSENNYNVYSEIIKLVDFKVLVLGLPVEDLEDVLTQFVVERGKISRSLYEDFLIANCIGNLNQFMAHIQGITNGVGGLDLIALRSEVIDTILKYNPALIPEKIYINKNQVLKLMPEDGSFNGMLLVDNQYWNKPYYDENGRYKPIADSSKSEDMKSFYKSKSSKGSEKSEDDVKDLKDIKWKEAKVWWERINEYIIIKKYTNEDIDHILRQRYFHNRTSFNTFIVSNCVYNVEEIYERIEGMGVNVDPNKVIRELFALCEGVNEGMNYKRAKELQGVEEEEDHESKSPTCRAQTGSGAATHKKKRNKKKFKDVPKQDLLKLADNMKVFLVGQDEAIDSLSEAIKRASVGLKDPIKPIGSFLFAGKTGCGKCVEENSLIFSEEGIKPIKDFYSGTKRQEPLKLSVSTSFGKEDTEFIYKEGKKPGRVIKTSIGNTLGGSMIHPVVVIDEKGEIKFKRFYEIENGDYVGIQYNQDYFSNKNTELPFEFNKNKNDSHSVKYTTPLEMNSDLAYYIGLLTGDGNLTIKNRISFCSIDKQLVNSFYTLSKKLFGVEVKLASDKYSYYYESVYIYQFLKSSCKVLMGYAKNKIIPSTILESTKECVKSFIQGLMDTDGYYECNRKSVGIALSTEKLIEDLQVVLFNFGIISTKRHRKVRYKDGFRDMYVLSITGKFVDIYFNTIGFKLRRKMDKKNNKLGVVNNPNKDIIPNLAPKLKELCKAYTFDRKFNQRYGGYIRGLRSPSRIKLNNFLKDVVSYVGSSVIDTDLYKYLASFIEQDIFWASVTSIEEKELELYDFTVPGSHTFISNGFISHNTLASKVLADELIKEKKNRIVIDCSEYTSDHEYAKLIGAPSGYIGHDSGGVLTNAVDESPFSVVVFDEVEKASSKVHELMLQILDEGRLTDGKGNTVSFKDTIIIMTSNIGVKEVEAISKTIGFGDVAKMTETKKSKALDEALKDKFKPEFLNRIDSVVHFKDLNKDDYMRIIDIELYKLSENLKTNDTEYKDIDLYFDEKVHKFIYKEGVDEKFGARPIKRAIEKYISTNIAIKLLENEIGPEAKVGVTVKRNKVTIDITDGSKIPGVDVIKQATGGN